MRHYQNLVSYEGQDKNESSDLFTFDAKKVFILQGSIPIFIIVCHNEHNNNNNNNIITYQSKSPI